jgi:DNA-binding CsgD family transcriptional regulator
MGRNGVALSARDTSRVRELQSELRNVPLDAEFSLETFVRDMGAVLGLPRASGYGLRQRADRSNDGQELSFAYTSGFDHQRFIRAFAPFVEQQTVNWATYNTSCPEPEQRNRAVRLAGAEIDELAATGLSSVAEQVFPIIGVRGHDQLRVVVCDGPSLLGWFGGFQPAAIEPRQRALLDALVPDLRHRLLVQRRLEDGSRLPLLDAALEAIGSAAAIVDPTTGRIREANTAARLRLDGEGRALRDELTIAARAGAHPSWSVTVVLLRGGARAALVIATVTAGARLKGLAAIASKRWNLTARQRDILTEVAEGHPNRTIAAVLGVSERTVEVHVTAVLEKAGVESRAALIAAVYSMQ